MKKVVVGMISRKNSLGKTEYLLLSSKRDFGKFTGLYYPPGGHLENNENEKIALVREIHEELGVEVEPIKQIAVTPGDVKDQITYWWLCNCPNTDFLIQEEEIANVRWIKKEEIKESGKLWPATKKFFEEFIFSK